MTRGEIRQRKVFRSALHEIILAFFLNASFPLDVEHIFALGTFYVLDYSSDRSSWITVSTYLILHLEEWPQEFAKALLVGRAL